MKTAVVLAARMPAGFALCRELLDNGISVMALDHDSWQTAESEERWMEIGRNANLEYKRISEVPLPSMAASPVYFIPLEDYLTGDAEMERAELLSLLEEDKIAAVPEKIALIQPDSVPAALTDFAAEVAEKATLRFQSAELVQFIVKGSQLWKRSGTRAVPLPGRGDSIPAAAQIVDYLNALIRA